MLRIWMFKKEKTGSPDQKRNEEGSQSTEKGWIGYDWIPTEGLCGEILILVNEKGRCGLYESGGSVRGERERGNDLGHVLQVNEYRI